jgi:hypothetical protein
VEGGPCYQLYTKCFYQNVLKPKLDDHGIFVTQAIFFLDRRASDRSVDLARSEFVVRAGWASRRSDAQGGLLLHLQHPQARLQA